MVTHLHASACSKTNYFIATLLFFLMLNALSSCSGSLHIEKSPDYHDEASVIQKIVTIEPNFENLDTRQPKLKRLLEQKKYEKKFNELLVSNSEKNKIQLLLIDAQNLKPKDNHYFNYLLPLKQHILSTNFNQDVLYKSKTKVSLFKPKSHFFEQTPQISSEYSWLADEYETPYFAIHGLISAVKQPRARWIWLLLFPPLAMNYFLSENTDIYYYMIVVNLQSSEIIYREVRHVQASLSSENLNAILYDSFKVLKKNRKK
ncbi:MAG: hypothetical protein ACPG5B_06320 [Chitinophagales bacterium]